MSIYPVKLNEWFPVTDQFYWEVSTMVKYNRCYACAKTNINYKKAYGHHSLMVGDVWCSYRCLKSNKKYKLDKRQKRKEKRILKRMTWIAVKI